MAKYLFALAALATQILALGPIAKGPLLNVQCSILPKCLGELPVDHPHVTPDDKVGPPKQPPLVVGVIVDPSRTADSKDPSCPSGRCIIVDPKDVCDGTEPNCLPFVNIRQPALPCDQKLPRCPQDGILLDPEVSCHLLDNKCPGGGVYVPVPPGDKTCRPWITHCIQGTYGCPLGHNVTDAPKWPPTQGQPIPGIPFSPIRLCNAIIPGCNPNTGLVFPWDPTKKCDARYPGCLADDILNKPIDGTKDPACPSGVVCKIINRTPCHPNQPDAPVGCMLVDPIPCITGTLGCSGTKLPDPVQECVPNSIGCSKEGIRLAHPPSSNPEDQVTPPGDHALILDPKGSLACAFKPVNHLPITQCAPVTVLNPPVIQTVTVQNPPVTIQKPPVTLQNPPITIQNPPVTIQKPAVVSTVTVEKAPVISTVTVHDSPVTTTVTVQKPPLSPKESAVVSPSSTPKPSPSATAPSTPTPSTKFRCSPDDNNPCKGGTAQGWSEFTLLRAGSGPYWTQNQPDDFRTQITNPENEDVILVLTDDRNKLEIFTVELDGQVLGKTNTVTTDYWQKCTIAEDCISRGWSHGYFKIPPGKHDLVIKWREGNMNRVMPDGSYNLGGHGQYALYKQCKC